MSISRYASISSVSSCSFRALWNRLRQRLDNRGSSGMIFLLIYVWRVLSPHPRAEISATHFVKISTTHFVKISTSFLSQRDHWINFRRSARRQIAGEEGDAQRQRRDQRKRRRVSHAQLE